MADEMLGVDLLLQLPGIAADHRAIAALRRLDRAMAGGDTCIAVADCAAAASEAPERWHQSLLATGLVGDAAARLPVVLEDGLLSSRRYYRYEAEIAADLVRRCADLSRLDELVADPAVADDVARLFPARSAARVDGVDWQRVAACVALAHGAALITGGPGTGKTTVAGTVIAIAARAMQRARGRALSVIIGAPTGKAAQRLRESLIATGQRLVAAGVLEAGQLQSLTEQVGTLHRLQHHRGLRGADLVVVDEVSMADAATLARVLRRLDAATQLLLLGDPRQLASVDAGHVLGELARRADLHVEPRLAVWYNRCGGERESLPQRPGLAPLAAAQVHLRKNWRSAASPAVTRLAAAIQESPLAVQGTLAETDLGPTAGRTCDHDGRQVPLAIERRDLPAPRVLLAELVRDWRLWAEAVVACDDPHQALAVHARRRVLCARRTGPLGAEWLNRGLEEALAAAGTIQRWDDGHYHGRPLMVTRNDYDLQLFNGDIGIVHGDRHAAHAYFPEADGSLRPVPVHRLDTVEPVFAMSIHKSQGSQFEHVDILTVADDSSAGIRELLTRELIYTAVTRAAFSLRLWADEHVLLDALARRTVRHTGLGRFLQRAGRAVLS